jgi:polysaccharide biosynthesis protein PslG
MWIRSAKSALTHNAKRLFVALLVATLLYCIIGHRGTAPTSAIDINNNIVAGTGHRLRAGISFGRLVTMPDHVLAETLDAVVETGARWVRFEMSWSDVQPASAQAYVWDAFDRIIAQARSRRLNVLPVLAYTPEWARPANCSNFACAPADPAQFAAFAGAAANRYSGSGVHTWEIWNEPNYSIFWKPRPDPVAYTSLLKASSAAIRSADSHAFVLLGGLATLETTGGDLSVADFLTESPESPLHFVDALAVHPYTFPYPASFLGPWASPWLPADSGLPYLQQVLASSGTPNLPIWITEYGAPTGGPGHAWNGSPDSLATGPDHVTEAQQAAMAADSIATAKSEPIIGSLFWYTYRDSASPLDSADSYYGITRADGSKKPAFTALREAIQGLTQ